MFRLHMDSQPASHPFLLPPLIHELETADPKFWLLRLLHCLSSRHSPASMDSEASTQSVQSSLLFGQHLWGTSFVSACQLQLELTSGPHPWVWEAAFLPKSLRSLSIRISPTGWKIILEVVHCFSALATQYNHLEVFEELPA